MVCKLCGFNETDIIYTGKLRNGAFGNYTPEDVCVYKCASCLCIFHSFVLDDDFYTSDTYRDAVEDDVDLDRFNARHDARILRILSYTGTEIYRNKVFMDIGCGGGGFADFINGVSTQVILVEPTISLSNGLREKGYEVFNYAEEAVSVYYNKIDVITSFDVIEHVKQPQNYLQTIYDLLVQGGQAFLGTPTDYPFLRKLVGKEFDSFVFSAQHPWIFSGKSLEFIAQKCGFSNVKMDYYTEYGLGNLIAWLQNRKPCGDVDYDFIPAAFEKHYKIDMAKEETADYMVMKLQK